MATNNKDAFRNYLQLEKKYSPHTVNAYLNDVEKNYTFSHKVFFRESFVLTDEKGSELLMMKPSIQWRSLIYEYQMTTSEILETFDEKNILLFISLHCANYYMSMMMGMGI